MSFCWGVEVVGEVLTFPLGNGPWQRHDQTFPEFELCVLRQLLGQNKRIPTEIYLYLEGMNFLFFPEVQYALRSLPTKRVRCAPVLF